MIFKNLQMSNNASQAGGREFEPRLPLELTTIEIHQSSIIKKADIIRCLLLFLLSQFVLLISYLLELHTYHLSNELSHVQSFPAYPAS